MSLPDKHSCSVVGWLERDYLHVAVGRGEQPWPIPVAAVPEDLRFPNKEFWLSWTTDSLTFLVFRTPDDPTPVGSGSMPRNHDQV
jgi:hypothetical protein